MEKKNTAKKTTAKRSATSTKAKKAATPGKTSQNLTNKPEKKAASEGSTKPRTVHENKKPVSAAAKKQSGAALDGSLGHGVGRRKSAVARVWFSRGSGKIIVNDTDYGTYFNTEITRLDAVKPFKICPVGANYNVKAVVTGGGPTSQAGAVRLGISRALVSLHEEVRTVLRQHGLLTVDSRNKERKKYGQRGARRKFQFVKR